MFIQFRREITMAKKAQTLAQQSIVVKIQYNKYYLKPILSS